MSERVDISAEVQALCVKMGVEPGAVLRIGIWPDWTVATVALRDDAGRFIVDDVDREVATTFVFTDVST